jgi:hypothetical protein
LAITGDIMVKRLWCIFDESIPSIATPSLFSNRSRMPKSPGSSSRRAGSSSLPPLAPHLHSLTYKAVWSEPRG